MPQSAEAGFGVRLAGTLGGWRALLCGAAFALLAAGAWAHGGSAVAPRSPGEVPRLDEARAVELANAALGRTVPDIEMRDRRDRPVRLSAYRGKPLLVSFIYTGCFEACPTQTRTLYESVKGLDVMLGESQFNVVSIGFNQPFDSPTAMRAFAAQHRIAYRNWEFLSPPADQVEALMAAFGFSTVATPAGFDHVLGVTVVDAEGRIHSQVLGDIVRADRLGVPLRRLLLYDQPLPTLGKLENLVERVRILCTVYDEETGLYRYDYKLVLVIVSGVLFFLSTLIYLGLELRNQWRRKRRSRASCPAVPQPASGHGA
ncbi:MAG TPA: SCO family protein [Ottowia sp.]|mgnify:CR=1 FL=1|uniref:SCO family protein n=1 Tax=Ottowia sp. TaxID=1898956 RepID=UPI002CB6A0A9|nr:SCO family protein [Ottowia sp.]HMN20436.1 SCO family protein [Ottowia sp.]